VSRRERRNDRFIAVVACRCETRQTVVRGKTSSVTARRTDFCGQLWRALSTFTFDVLSRTDDLSLHKQPVFLKGLMPSSVAVSYCSELSEVQC